MEFTNPRRSIAMARQHLRQRQADDVLVTREMMKVMLQAIHAMLVTMQSGQNRRATGTATGRVSKRVFKQHAVLGQRIDMRSHRHRIAIAPQRWTLVVRHEQDDVLFRCQQKRCFDNRKHGKYKAGN